MTMSIDTTPDRISLAGITTLISGGSRGIGHAVAVALGAQGANVALLAKTDSPHPKLEGTVHTAAADVDAAGGRGLAVVGDVRREEDVQRAVQETAEAFGGIDILINNASAIDLSPAGELDMRRYDLMQDVNARGAYLLTSTALPYLRRGAETARQAAEHAEEGAGFAPHILTFAPPLNLDPGWFGAHLGYTISKYAMSMTTLGFAEQLREDGIRANSLWPATLIETAAVKMLAGQAEAAGQRERGEAMLAGARTPEIMGEAAVALLTGQAGARTGELLTDEQVLAAAGVADLSRYAVDPQAELAPDLFL